MSTALYIPGVCDDVCESSALQELHDDPELVLDQEAVVHLDNVWVVVVPHDDHLEVRESGMVDARYFYAFMYVGLRYFAECLWFCNMDLILCGQWVTQAKKVDESQ